MMDMVLLSIELLEILAECVITPYGKSLSEGYLTRAQQLMWGKKFYPTEYIQTKCKLGS